MHRPARVDLLVAIPHADDASLAAGAGAGIAGAVGVQKRDATPRFPKTVGDPCPEHAGSDDGHVVDVAARHAWRPGADDGRDQGGAEPPGPCVSHKLAARRLPRSISSSMNQSD